MTDQNRALLNGLASDGKLKLSHTVSHSHISLTFTFTFTCSFVFAHKPFVKMPKRPLDQSQISVTLKSQVLLHFFVLFWFDLIWFSDCFGFSDMDFVLLLLLLFSFGAQCHILFSCFLAMNTLGLGFLWQCLMDKRLFGKDVLFGGSEKAGRLFQLKKKLRLDIS